MLHYKSKKKCSSEAKNKKINKGQGRTEENSDKDVSSNAAKYFYIFKKHFLKIFCHICTSSYLRESDLMLLLVLLATCDFSYV